jgi:hypothetical protein
LDGKAGAPGGVMVTVSPLVAKNETGVVSVPPSPPTVNVPPVANAPSKPLSSKLLPPELSPPKPPVNPLSSKLKPSPRTR